MKRMYKENRKSLNWFVGCEHNCVYCKPSFQRQMKRQKQNCLRCYEYTPHFHKERLLRGPPKTLGDEFIFFPSSGDVAFATREQVEVGIDYTRKYRNCQFLIQSKNPECFQGFKFPENVILATTLESDRRVYSTPSMYKTYERISSAPVPIFRFVDFKDHPHKRKIVTVEPILDFSDILVSWIFQIAPEAVYVGYDNYDCRLPEPKLNKTLKLIEELKRFTDIRRKTIRKAWYEV